MSISIEQGPTIFAPTAVVKVARAPLLGVSHAVSTGPIVAAGSSWRQSGNRWPVDSLLVEVTGEGAGERLNYELWFPFRFFV